MRKLKVASIQMKSKPYEVEKNVKLALKLAQKGVDKGAKLIVFPELFDSGYCVNDKDFELALDFSNPHSHFAFKALSNFAKNTKTFLIACTLEKENHQIFDTAFVLSAEGKLLGKYRKIYLWGEEKERFEQGKKYEVFELDFKKFKVKIGLQICYELGFSEGARILALSGAEILAYPSAFGKARTYAWELALRARALENACYVIASNHSSFELHYSSKEKLEFAGKSRIINPQAKVLKQAKNKNECIVQELNLDLIRAQRENIPYLKDINLELTSSYLAKLKSF
ncbi:carbon-nitrogen hydrolase family protein [Campylobacter sp. MIT 12-8780]|uniref:carbon-nitrogen hydrolase family protein n=1 Tax=unclassified Campylobacter TaxID=2593542 RepID=UPI00115D23E7|nr:MULTISPECIES: carbon-nitrogen hydrolase family protein [unclassified Campylobacter]NDJ27432.1 carbon-nitrogen hydrolase family protein [Campylobacter sp. MIT 19-121]TQR41196.1 carbon-nitrogen hydrolase family protein [Campylobacter sp. MIT 12-8780]